jgi:hypothetical protein
MHVESLRRNHGVFSAFLVMILQWHACADWQVATLSNLCRQEQQWDTNAFYAWRYDSGGGGGYRAGQGATVCSHGQCGAYQDD